MKKIKIWAISNWQEAYDDNNVVTRLKRNWPITDLFEFDEKEYEYLIVLGGFRTDTIKYFKDKNKTIGFVLEPEWNENWQRDLDRYCKYIVAQEKQMFPEGNVIEHASFMLTQSTDSYKFYTENNFIKNKRMSFITSNYNHKFNYFKRHDLFVALLKTGLEIDFYGRDWKTKDPRYKGSPYNKSDGIINYEYSIAIENSCYKNYLTEKFFDLIVCNTVPIYYGCTNVKDIYPDKSFIQIDFSNGISKAVDQITKIYYLDNYQERLSSVLEAKKLYYTKYNIFNFLENLIKEGKL